MFWHRKNQLSTGGFSLIELIVVIGIIGVLATMGVVSFQNAARTSRDGKRKADLSQVQSSLELYRSSIGITSGYPAGNYAAILTTLSSAGYLLAPFPQDPKNVSPYFYTYTRTTPTSYCLCARMEGTSGNRAAANCTAAAGTTYFCAGSL